MKLSDDIKSKIARYEPVDTEGFVLYPMKVEDYRWYLMAKESIGYITQELPIELMGRPILESFFKIDYDLLKEGKQQTGLFMSSLIAIVLALRLSPDKSMRERINELGFVVDENDESKVRSIVITTEDGERKEITPVQFSRLRVIIAEQNGIEIVSDSANPEIVRAERDLSENRSTDLKFSIENLVEAACVLFNVEENEVYKWSILKLNRRLKAMRRIIDYGLCSIAEYNGCAFKKGNPCPHPWFERENDSSGGLMPLEQFANGEGLKAVNEFNGE